jgi:hypothetical protein
MTPAAPIQSPADSRAMAAAWTAVIMAALGLLMFVRGDIALVDPDTQWHIAAGRLMWETGAMPRVDTMSHTYAGQPWIAKEWLSQVILFGAWALGGWLGVFALTTLSVAAGAGIVAWRLFRGLAPFAALMVMWVVINSLLGIAVARPHALALPVMALFTLMLLNAAERDQTPPWLALPLITLWANLHAAFTLGFIVAAFLGLDAILRAAPERRLKLVVQWGLFGLGCLAACCVHPYGAQPLLINFQLASGNESVPLINEWNHHEILGPIGYRIIVPALLVATLALRWRANAARLMLGVFAVYLAWKHQRFIMLLAVVAPMISRDAFAAAMRAAADRFGLFQGADPLRDPKWRAPALIGCLAAFLALPFTIDRPKPPEMIAPMAALNTVPPELRATSDARLQQLQSRRVPDPQRRAHLHRRAHGPALH